MLLGLLGGSWARLGRVLGPLGAVWGPSWGLLGPSWDLPGPSWDLPGRSWGLLGGSKTDPKIDPKIEPKSSRIATEKNRSGATPVDVSELDKARRESDPGRLEIYRYRF